MVAAPSRRGRGRIAVGAIVVGLVLVLASCGSPAPKGRDELTLFNDKGSWSTYFDQVAKMSKEQTGLGMEPVGYDDQPTYQTYIRASFRTKAKPDLFTWATGGPMRELVEGGALADTSDIWKEGIESGDLTKDIEKYYTVDGKQYCVPANTSYWVMFYNKKVFADNDVEPPETWQDLMAISEKLKSNDVTPLYQTTVVFNFFWFQQLMIGTDPKAYDALNAGRIDYTHPSVVRVMKLWKSMIDKGYFNDPGNQTAAETLLKSGQVAMVPMGTFFNTTLTTNGLKPGKDYGMFAIPNVDPGLPKTNIGFETGPLCALADAPDLATSEKFMRWWIGSEPQDVWANSRGDTSANPKVRIDDPVLDRLAKRLEGPQYQLYNRYFDASPPQIRAAGQDAFSAFMADPGSYREQLESVQRAADSYWAKYGTDR